MEKVRFAVVGVGGFGMTHASNICCSPMMELVCVCDIRQSVAMNRADLYNCTYYTDYKEMLKDGGFDCVVVSTNDQSHAEISIAALNAGYHVLCEKPLALTKEDCLAVIAAVKSSGRIFAVGQSMRRDSRLPKIKELLAENKCGEIFSIAAEYSHNYSRFRPEWRRDPVNLRYPMVGAGCHVIDCLRWTLGEDPCEVIAISNHMALKSWPVDDCIIALIKMPSGIIGKITCSIGIQRPYNVYLNYYGTGGTLEVNMRGKNMVYHQPIIENGASVDFRTTEIEVGSTDSHYVASELNEIARAILYGEPISCDVYEGAKNVAVALAAVESARLGGAPVKPDYDFN